MFYDCSVNREMIACAVMHGLHLPLLKYGSCFSSYCYTAVSICTSELSRALLR